MRWEAVIVCIFGIIYVIWNSETASVIWNRRWSEDVLRSSDRVYCRHYIYMLWTPWFSDTEVSRLFKIFSQKEYEYHKTDGSQYACWYDSHDWFLAVCREVIPVVWSVNIFSRTRIEREYKSHTAKYKVHTNTHRDSRKTHSYTLHNTHHRVYPSFQVLTVVQNYLY